MTLSRLSTWRLTVAALLILPALEIRALSLPLPELPSLQAVKDYKPRMPLQILTSDGALIAEYGEERRYPVKINEVPALMKKAILAAEDDGFYEHGGVDFMGVARAAVANVVGGGKRQGASTITMQVARNFYLSNEKTYSRKFNEIRLAVEIEKALSKDQILELYINQIYLGQRAYGFQAAAVTYFGRPLKELGLAEMAMLAGLPKAPSLYNPVVNMPRAKERQAYVLGRLKSLGWINSAEHERALRAPIAVRRGGYSEVKAPHLAELARQAVVSRYGEAAYSSGFKVYTTLRRKEQLAATRALAHGLLAYDRRHGYKGPEARMALPAGRPDGVQLDKQLASLGTVSDLQPAVVLAATPQRVEAYLEGGRTVTLSGEGLAFARKALASGQIRRGDIIRVAATGGSMAIRQLPQVEGAFVALNSHTGAVVAMVGSFDYGRNKLNHVTQAWRQPGSALKPFLFAAALEKGLTGNTLLEDSPLSLADGSGSMWSPKNYDGTFGAPLPLREALAQSRNLPAIRLLMAVGPEHGQAALGRFGFDPEKHPPYLTMALGAGSVTPMQLARGYAIFANGGKLVHPNFVTKIVDGNGKVVSVGQTPPPEAVLEPRHAQLMTAMLHDVVSSGTGSRARALGRPDLAGKTGTTNDQTDVWFAGYHPSLVAVSWLGFSKPQSLGAGETGGGAALPIWMEFMASALQGVPHSVLPDPEAGALPRIVPPAGADPEALATPAPQGTDEPPLP